MNLGIASVTLEIFDTYLPNVSRSYWSTFDVSSFSLNLLSKNSEEKPAKEVDSTIFQGGEKGGGFAVIHPRRGVYQVNNFVQDDIKWTLGKSPRFVDWIPIDTIPAVNSSILSTFDLARFRTDALVLPSVEYPDSYKGPRWMTSVGDLGYKDFAAEIEEVTGESWADLSKPDIIVDSSGAEDTSSKFHTTWAEQYQASSDMWWATQTATFDLAKNLGFWIVISKETSSKSELRDFLVVRINPQMSTAVMSATMEGATGDADRPGEGSFEIVMSGTDAYLVDISASHTRGSDEYVKVPLNGGGSVHPGQTIKIGVIPVAGRLVIDLNGATTQYARVNKSSQTNDTHTQSLINDTIPFSLKTTCLEVWGSNCKAKVNLAAMVYYPGSIEPNPASGLPTVTLGATATPAVFGAPTPDGKMNGTWDSSADGLTLVPVGGGGSYAEFPGFGGKKNVGICAETVNGVAITPGNPEDNGSCPEDGKWGAVDVSFGPGTEADATLMRISMGTNSDLNFGSGTVFAPLSMGAPFVYRLRGAYANEIPGSGGEPSSDAPVISLSDSFDSTDYTSIQHTLDVTVYNPGGSWNIFRDKMVGIRVSIGWDTGESQVVFTGVSLDATCTEIAGKETITFKCSDYCHILEVTKIMNSPYFDGMADYSVVKELCTRSGIQFVDDTNHDGPMGTYYVPAGYSFSEPRMRFPSDMAIKDCLNEVCKLGEKVYYFDADGVLHLEDLQGGLAYDVPFATVADFFRDPDNLDDEVILEQKAEEFLVGSTVNEIFVYSMDRMSGNPIVWHDVNSVSQVVPFRKMLFYDQPAFGNVSAVANWVEMIKERVYKVPRRITIKTVSTKKILPLSFINVDGKPYRVKSVTRRYDADRNSLTTELSGEWMGD